MATRATQVFSEVLIIPDDRAARITQEFAEVLLTPSVRSARVTQMYLEVLVSSGEEPAAGRVLGPALQMMG